MYNKFRCHSKVGSIAQLGEHLPYKQGVTGSSPVVPTILFLYGYKLGPVVQLVRTLACHARGRRFEPVPGRHFAAIAQSVERILGKDEVTSSNLVSSSIKTTVSDVLAGFFVFGYTLSKIRLVVVWSLLQ